MNNTPALKSFSARYTIFITLTLMLSISQLHAHLLSVNAGENYKLSLTGDRCVFLIGATQVYSITGGSVNNFTSIYHAPGGLSITWAYIKKGASPGLVLTLSNNQVLIMNDYGAVLNTFSFPTGWQYTVLACGDNITAETNQGGVYMIYVSNNNGQSWLVDTTGAGGIYGSLDIDASQNVIIATSTSGIFRQAAHGNAWSVVSTSPQTFLYANHQDRWWAGDGRHIYNSTDGGINWAIDTSLGTLPLLWNEYINGCAEDLLGNMYFLTFLFGLPGSHYKMYKSTGGTSHLARIDQALVPNNQQANNANFINAISGDSAGLYASTVIGHFYSNDGGTSWQYLPGIQSDCAAGIVRANDGSLLVTNSIGCFKEAPGSTVWAKTYPANGYVLGRPIYRDSTGNLFTQGYSFASDTGYASQVLMVVKSTDNGQTWNPDTAGCGDIDMGLWWVDEAGNQYAASTILSQSNTNYFKPANGSWGWDGQGVSYVTSAFVDKGLRFGGDGNGGVYYSILSGYTFSKFIGTGPWVLNPGLSGKTILSFAHTSKHVMIAGGTGVNYGGYLGWAQMPLSAPLPDSVSVRSVAVDDSDNVWASFYNAHTAGVYFTPDSGGHWYPAVGQTASAIFGQLVPVGDSVFGIVDNGASIAATGFTSIGGSIYVFKRHGSFPSGLRQISAIPGFSLYPNPASSVCNSVFTLPDDAKNTEMVVYDITGKVVKRIVIAHAATQLSFATNDWARGTYICTIQIDGKVAGAERLVVQ